MLFCQPRWLPSRVRLMRLLLGWPLLALLLPMPSPARAEERVDLQLVLTVDVSLSMDLEEQRLQRDGYVAAFRDRRIWEVISAGTLRRIAVAYVEWAGELTQTTVLGWTLIDSPAASEDFAAALEAKPISRARMTSISGALAYAAAVLDDGPFRGTRRVIDVSGDGPNNAGRPVIAARDAILERGIIINGLPILLKQGGPFSNFDIPDLDAYYAECVIGGAGSFSLPVRDKSEFTAAIRQKLVLEIASTLASMPRLLRAQAKTADCLIGERLWRQYLDGNIR